MYWTMILKLSALLASTVSLALAGNNTVTQEVFFDVKIGGDNKVSDWHGSFVVGVFGESVPMTAFNFVSLAKGFQHRHEKWTYENCRFHRILPDSLIQTGDVVLKDGRSGRSIYSVYFIDEGFFHSHQSGGYVGMANSGPDSNGSQFYVTLTKSRWLDNKNVVVGKVVSGWDAIKKISHVDVYDWNQYPKRDIQITASGMLPLKNPYDLTKAQLSSEADIKSHSGVVGPE